MPCQDKHSTGFYAAVNAQLRAEEVKRLRVLSDRLFKQAMVDLGMTQHEMLAGLRGPRQLEIMAHLVPFVCAQIDTPEGRERVRQLCDNKRGK